MAMASLPSDWPSLPSFDQLLVLARFAPDDLTRLQRELLLKCQANASSDASKHLIQQLMFQLHSPRYQAQAPAERLQILFQGMASQMLQLEHSLQQSQQQLQQTSASSQR
jgi:hypothetical protein